MSDPNYAPYGVDDDPFLTHPAGVGRAPLRADHRYGQPQMAAQPAMHRVGAAPRQMPPAPARGAGYSPYSNAPDYASQDYAPQDYTPQDYSGQEYAAPQYDTQQYFGHAEPAPVGDPWAAQRAEHASYGADPAQFQVQPQQGNFRPRATRDTQYDQAFAPDYHGGYVPQHAEPAPQYRAEPRVSAPHAAAAHRLDVASHNAPPRQAAAFAAPPRAAQPQLPRAAQPAYTAPKNAQRSYAPLPQQQTFESYEEAGFASGLIPNPAKLVQLAGAVCTILGLIGAVYWGYALAVRDAHGIPVVRAQVEPLRIAPETPGGEISANQGLAVNTIPATGISPAAPDQITLAPQMAELAPEDTQIIEGGSFAQTAGAGSDAALAGASDKVLVSPEVLPETTGGLAADLTALPDTLPEDMPMTDAEAVERALEAALAEGGDPIMESAKETLAPAATLAEETVAAQPIASEPASMSNTDPIAPPTAELDPATIAVGTPLAQLGAFDTAETARAEWANLQTRFTELMAGKALVVEPAKSGGRDFFRLRAHGFASADDTRRFCAAILAENGSCFPVDQR